MSRCGSKLGLSSKTIRCCQERGHSGPHSAVVNGIPFTWRPARIGRDVEVGWDG